MLEKKTSIYGSGYYLGSGIKKAFSASIPKLAIEGVKPLMKLLFTPLGN